MPGWCVSVRAHFFMATVLPSRPRQSGTRRDITIVVSTYHQDYARGLIDHARRELAEISPGAHIQVHAVPGSYEIPLAVQWVMDRGDIDAVIAFGVIMEGQTAHATLISTAVTDALMRIALNHRIPVIHEVLVLETEEQARVRCLEDELNRGTEAARAAVRMIDLAGDFPRRPSR